MRHKELRDNTFFAERIRNIHVGDGMIRGRGRDTCAGDLLKCGGQTFRVTRQKRSRRIGQELTLPGDRKFDQGGNDRSKKRENEPDEDEHTLCFVIPPSAAEAMPRPQKEVGKDRHKTHEHNDDGRNECIAISHMGKFVRQHSFKFATVQDGKKPGVYRDRRMLFVAPRRKGVRRRVVHNIEFGHRKSCGDRKIFNNIPKLRVILAKNRRSMHHRKHELVGIPVTSHVHKNADGDRNIEEARAPIRLRKYETDSHDKDEEPREKYPRFCGVFRLMCVERGHESGSRD